MTAAAAVALLCSAGGLGGLGGTAWADEPTPAPAAPAVQPTVGTWIIGGTLLAGTQAKPAAKPAAKPVAKPAVQPRTAVAPAVAPPAAPAADTTVLPFTGPGHVDLLLPIGLLLVGAGVGMSVAGRPRSVRP